MFSRIEIFVWSGATLTKSSVGLMILTAGQRSSFSAFLVISHATVGISSRFLLIPILIAI